MANTTPNHVGECNWPRHDLPWLIFGSGDFAVTACHYLVSEGGEHVTAFVVDDPDGGPDEVLGRPVLSLTDALEQHPPGTHQIFAAIGYSDTNKRRTAVVKRLREHGYALGTYVSPRASVTGPVTIGEHCFVFEENVIQPNVSIGDNVILWSGNHVGHDVTIESNCFIASHVVLSGNVSVGNHTFMGVNATVRDGVQIGPANIIGMSAIVMKDTEEGTVLSPRRTEPHPKRSWELAF